MRVLVLSIVAAVWAGAAFGQQEVDRFVDVSVNAPVFAENAGPLVAIDGAHQNFHQLDERFAPFAALVRNDGFRTAAFSEAFSADSLKSVRILVIANPVHPSNAEVWRLPTPSAFTPDEIAAVKAWVNDGGSLLLIADHFPFAGAANDLAQAFGFEFRNAYARSRAPGSIDTFALKDGSLKDVPILRGRTSDETVSSIATFTGSAFTAPDAAQPILVLSDDFELTFPTDADDITADTPRGEGGGLLQGAMMTFGKGRLAVFGEAAMFTAQRAGPKAVPMGFNAPEAAQNKQFILNLMRWLAAG